eukprot:g2139.t1
MRIDIDGLEIAFPYPSMYKEQLQYVRELKKALDEGGHGLLEMPTGTGKTVALLSLILAYRAEYPAKIGKLIYCTRTVPEMGQVIDELKTIIEYRKRLGIKERTLGVCLSSRRNMCINEDVMRDNDLEEVDTQCRAKTAPWVRQTIQSRPGSSTESSELCSYFETLDISEPSVSPGIYGLDDLKALGRRKGLCPYFLTRQIIQQSDVIVYNYQYMLDPKVSSLVSSQLEHDSVVVFDEAHNIDNVCIEAFSINLNKRVLGAATGNLARLRREVQTARETDAEKLREEYRRLVEGLPAATAVVNSSNVQTLPAAPILPDDILAEAVPGNIRRAEHFLSFLNGVVEFLKKSIDVKDVVKKIPTTLRSELLEFLEITDRKPLRFCYTRLNRLLRTLEITDVAEYTPLSLVADFTTVLATYDEGFMLIIEPTQSHAPNLVDPLMQLTCTDSSLAMQPVFKNFRSVIITSGTLSPISLYPHLLNFTPKISQAFEMTMPEDRGTILCPLIVTRGSDQTELTTKFEARDDPAISRNYGDLLVNLSQHVPDGIVCFFTSYKYMEDTVTKWKEVGVLKQILRNKLIFIETKDIVETTLALDNYRRACDSGRGAVFFSVARGKVAEGVNFEHHYGRAVVMFGIPYQYTQSRVLRARLEYLEAKFQVKHSDFLTFDAMRQTAQCMGRVIRSKKDYGVMIFADKRYGRYDKRSKLPQWIQKHFSQEHLNLTTDIAIDVTKRFLKAMAQEVSVSSSSTKEEEEEDGLELNGTTTTTTTTTSTTTTTTTTTPTTTTTTTSKTGSKRKRDE